MTTQLLILCILGRRTHHTWINLWFTSSGKHWLWKQAYCYEFGLHVGNVPPPRRCSLAPNFHVTSQLTKIWCNCVCQVSALKKKFDITHLPWNGLWWVKFSLLKRKVDCLGAVAKGRVNTENLWHQSSEAGAFEGEVVMNSSYELTNF